MLAKQRGLGFAGSKETPVSWTNGVASSPSFVDAGSVFLAFCLSTSETFVVVFLSLTALPNRVCRVRMSVLWCIAFIA